MQSQNANFVFRQQTIGQPRSDRVIVVFISSYGAARNAQDGIQGRISSITVAGVSGSNAIASYRSAQARAAEGLTLGTREGDVLGDATIWSFAVPADITEADIVIRFARPVGGCAVTVYALYGTPTAAVTATRTYLQDTERARPTVTVDAPAGGICIGGQMSANIPLTGIAWTGLARQDQFDHRGHYRSTAMRSFADAVYGLEVSTLATSVHGDYRCYRTLLVACWGPG